MESALGEISAHFFMPQTNIKTLDGKPSGVFLLVVDMKKIVFGLLLIVPVFCFAAPTELTGDTAHFSWDASASLNVVSYNVYVSGSKINRSPITGLSFAFVMPIEWDEVVKRATVTAVNDKGVESGASNPQEFIKISQPPAAPTNLLVSDPVGS